MDDKNFFKDIFESRPDYRKIALLKFSSQNDKDFLREVGFNERDINRLNSEFKNILIEEHEENLDYVKNL